MQTESVIQLVERGKQCYAQERFGEAIAHFGRAAELDPTCKDAFTQLGLLYKDLGDDQGAVDFWHRAAQLDEGDAFLQLNLGLVYFQHGVAEGAKAHFERTVTLMEDGIAQARTQVDPTDAAMTTQLLEQCTELEGTLVEVKDLLRHLEETADVKAA